MSAAAPRGARRILREPEVRARTGLSGSTIRRRVKDGAFPKPVAIGRRAVGWFEDELADFLERLASGRDA